MQEFPEKIWKHIPVLSSEVVQALTAVQPLRRVIDGTLGNGGHTGLLLEAVPELEVLGIDRDEAALERASKHLERFGSRFHAVHGEYADLDMLSRQYGWESVDGILLDIGVSSPQIDDPERGFSWKQDGPLDMRMDRSQPLTASRVINQYSMEELTRVFRDYGELREARQLAQAIVKAREICPLQRTSDLTKLCDSVFHRRPGTVRLPQPTLAFQALRIEVNGELEQLKKGLQAAKNMLRPRGRMAVISFHSLEDRIVKNFIRDAAQECVCPPGLPVCVCGHHAELTIPVRGPIEAQEAELQKNRRAASAKLRIADRTEWENKQN